MDDVLEGIASMAMILSKCLQQKDLQQSMAILSDIMTLAYATQCLYGDNVISRVQERVPSPDESRRKRHIGLWHL